MELDLFTELAEIPVPPVPADLDKEVHRRLNRVLLTSQLVEFCWQALPQAALAMFACLRAFLTFTITGKMTDKSDGVSVDNA